MAVPMVTRAGRAAGILERQELEPLDNGKWRVRDTDTGSGIWHITDTDRCDCYDSIRGTCKHQLAVRREEQVLRQYAADWDTGALELMPTALLCWQCGGPAEPLLCHLGGHGFVTWALCTVDSAHPARRLS